MSISDMADYRRLTPPLYPCRELFTRACPEIYNDVCGDRPCARYESRDETPWIESTSMPYVAADGWPEDDTTHDELDDDRL